MRSCVLAVEGFRCKHMVTEERSEERRILVAVLCIATRPQITSGFSQIQYNSIHQTSSNVVIYYIKLYYTQRYYITRVVVTVGMNII